MDEVLTCLVVNVSDINVRYDVQRSIKEEQTATVRLDLTRMSV